MPSPIREANGTPRVIQMKVSKPARHRPREIPRATRGPSNNRTWMLSFNRLKL